MQEEAGRASVQAQPLGVASLQHYTDVLDASAASLDMTALQLQPRPARVAVK